VATSISSSGQTSGTPTGGDPLQPLDLAGSVRRHWRLITTVTCAAVAVTLAYCLWARPWYRSATQLLVLQKDSSLPTRSVDAASDVFVARLAEEMLATHMQILASPLVIRRALQRDGLDQLPSIRAAASGAGGDAVEYVRGHLEVTRGGEGQAQEAHVLNARFTHTSPEESQQILEAVVASYREFVEQKFRDASLEAVRLISRARAELNEDLQSKEANYRQFRAETPLLWQGGQTVNIHQTRLLEIEKSLVENQLRRARVDSRLAIVHAALDESQDRDGPPDLQQIALIDSDDVARLSLLASVQRDDGRSAAFQSLQPVRVETANAEYDRLLALRLEAKNLELELGANHPRVVQARQNIQGLEDFVAERTDALGAVTVQSGIDPLDLLRAYARLLEHDLVELKVRREELQGLADAELDAARELASAELRGESLRREIERSQELYDTVVNRLREMNLIKDYGGYITEVIAPMQPGQKVWPKIMLAAAGAVAVGLLLGAAAAVGRDLAGGGGRDAPGGSSRPQ
jgi:uncharacterized protein involved in exopolysaccharide biosynthesis